MRCIAHLDMDCFYAQVEAVRLGVDCRTTPLVLSQWDFLIAVNYPARAYGIKRGLHNVHDARRLCPDVIVALSPSYRVGEAVSQYHPHPTRDHYKISLEPYREASRKIFSILRAEPGVQVEKGSVDEAYMDVTVAAQRELAQLRAASTAAAAPLDALHDVLEPSTRLIEDRRGAMEAWYAERGTSLEAVFDAPMRALLRGTCGAGVRGSRGFCVSRDDAAYEERCLLLCAASRVVWRLRQRLYAELHYDCSAGIAHNRVLAKCISATHKPNQQTLLLPDRSASALFDLPLKELRGFGGKFGAAVRAVCGGATECRELWMAPLPQLYALDGTAFATAAEADDDGDDGGDGGGGSGDNGDNVIRAAAHQAGSSGGSGVRKRRRSPYMSMRGRRVPSSRATRDASADGVHGSCSGGGDESCFVAHDASLYAYYRMRGVAEDTVANRTFSKSLIASKQFGGAATSSLDVIQQWVVVLCAELCSRYDDFTALFHVRGRSWNIKLGNDGFRRMGGVMNRTVALPDAVQPAVLTDVTLREIQTVWRRHPGVTADSVTLTISGFVSDNTGVVGVVPTLGVMDDAEGRRHGGGGRHYLQRPPRQQTLHAFFPAMSSTTPSHTAQLMSDEDSTDVVVEGDAVVRSSSTDSDSDSGIDHCNARGSGEGSDVVVLSLSGRPASAVLISSTPPSPLPCDEGRGTTDDVRITTPNAAADGDAAHRDLSNSLFLSLLASSSGVLPPATVVLDGDDDDDGDDGDVVAGDVEGNETTIID
jgi:DNA polymerase eta